MRELVPEGRRAAVANQKKPVERNGPKAAKVKSGSNKDGVDLVVQDRLRMRASV